MGWDGQGREREKRKGRERKRRLREERGYSPQTSLRGAATDNDFVLWYLKCTITSVIQGSTYCQWQTHVRVADSAVVNQS